MPLVVADDTADMVDSMDVPMVAIEVARASDTR